MARFLGENGPKKEGFVWCKIDDFLLCFFLKMINNGYSFFFQPTNKGSEIFRKTDKGCEIFWPFPGKDSDLKNLKND